MRAAYDLSRLAKNGKLLDGKKAEATTLMKAFVESLQQSADALPRWLQAISGGELSKDAGSILAVNESIKGMESLAAYWGVDLK
jgi:hypothetical protein